MVKIHKQAGKYRLAGIALCLIAVGCSDRSRTETLSRRQGALRVQDVYQNTSPEVVRYDRYTLASTRPADAQRDPLNQIIEIRMPQQLVRTVGEGLRYLLLESGYSLCNGDSTLFSELFSKPLPAVQRDIGPVRLSEALQIVAGPAWRLTLDEVNREICFALRDQYRSFVAPAPAPVLPTVRSVSESRTVVKPAALPATVGNTNSALPRNPFSGDRQTVNIPATGQKLTLAPQNLSVPSPELAGAKTPAVQNVSASVQSTVKSTPVSSSALAPKITPPLSTSATPARPVTVPQTTVNATRQAGPLRPVTSLPPAPPVSSQTSSTRGPGTPVTALPSGQTWRAEPGSTLKETLTGWAAKAPCSNGGNWVVIWPVSLDYRIDAPLVFQGNFESVLVQLFDLYRKAEKPLFAEASRIQCLISVSDTPAGGGH